MKMYGATDGPGEPGKPQGWDETGTDSSEVPGIGIEVKNSVAANHTYQMEKDALTEEGHKGFVTDAQTMAALLFDVATRPEYLKAIRREFAGIKVCFPSIRRIWGRSILGRAWRNHSRAPQRFSGEQSPLANLFAPPEMVC
jgi:hypothetical protein